MTISSSDFSNSFLWKNNFVIIFFNVLKPIGNKKKLFLTKLTDLWTFCNYLVMLVWYIYIKGFRRKYKYLP